MEGDSDGTTACGSVDRNAIKYFTTHAQVHKKTNKLVSDVKLNETRLTIHPSSRHLKWNDLALIGCTNEAQGDRIDGGSTGGYVLTMAPYSWFIEGHMTDMTLLVVDTSQNLGRVGSNKNMSCKVLTAGNECEKQELCR